MASSREIKDEIDSLRERIKDQVDELEVRLSPVSKIKSFFSVSENPEVPPSEPGPVENSAELPDLEPFEEPEMRADGAGAPAAEDETTLTTEPD